MSKDQRDGTRKKIWAGWGEGAGANGDIRLIDPVAGTSTVVFNAHEAASINSIDDGLAYDDLDDTLYVSPDGSTQIYHYPSNGSSLLDQFA